MRAVSLGVIFFLFFLNSISNHNDERNKKRAIIKIAVITMMNEK